MTVAGPALRLQRVRVGDLPAFAGCALRERARYTILPITVQRAEAQARNPAASPDDVGLIVAYLEDRCVGYLGVFPVWLEDPHRRRKALSLSTYFVGHEYRGTGAGALLLLHAVSLGQDLFVAGISEAAERVCKRVGFREVGPLVSLNLRIDAALVLPVLLGRFRHAIGGWGDKHLGGILAGARTLSRLTLEAALRPLVIRFLLRPLRGTRRDVVFSPVESVRSPEELRRPGKSPVGPRFVRDDAVVNWMIHHPWIKEDPFVRLDYAFSHCREKFRFLPFELRAAANGQALGYVVLRLSADTARTVITILDCVLADERHRPAVLGLTLREALRWSADRIECAEEFDPILRSSFLQRVLTRREQRVCLLFTSDRNGSGVELLRNLKVGFCDGDAPFA